MNHLRQFCAAVVLTFGLTIFAFAGDIHTGTASMPAEPTVVATDGSTDKGTSSSQDDYYVESLTDVALSILQSLLPLF
ncbi:MAG TPA: hypothetical protein VF723_03740 [Pyrinomonadaceae bacterium]|jgi:hypothetical protein